MITLRLPLASDADALFPQVYRTAVTDTICWDGPESLESYREGMALGAERSARGEIHFFTIQDALTGAPLGVCDLRPYKEGFRGEIGIWIGAAHQGKNAGTQAVFALADYAFNRLHMEKVEAFIFTGNFASRRIFERNGFLLEGTVRNGVRKRGRLLDEWLLGLTRQDWLRDRDQRWIVHICTRPAWEQALAAGEYRAASLQTEGFIHCSRPGQVLRTANRFFPAARDLTLLWIDPARLKSELRWETSDGELFPHLSGPLELAALLCAAEFSPNAEGEFDALPEAIQIG
ncbi:MAG: GNAT family N-acetyltransferase [Chloroflexi bacterium]|nr:GNAT family N-acetyltransferase [Chloroflexota bacterium]